MNKTKIEWVENPDGTQGYTLNSKTGCLNHTPEGLCLGGMFPCYAYKLANGRLRSMYLANKNWDTRTPQGYEDYPNLDPFYPRWWRNRLLDMRDELCNAKPRGIFLDDMSDWMGDYWPEEWTKQELQVMRDRPQHRFYTLTKQPQNLIKFSPFPYHCYVGVTATDEVVFMKAIDALWMIEAELRYISLEPLLGRILTNWRELVRKRIGWLIIGAMTGTKSLIMEMAKKYPELTPMPWGRKWTLQPKIEWVEEIVRAADQAGIPMFLKNNLYDHLAKHPEFYTKPYLGWWELRQEMP